LTDAEIKLLATVAWKENRRGGVPGMTSIINVVQNRVAHPNKHWSDIESVIMAPWQFTSMSVGSDPEYSIDPSKSTGADLLAWGNAQGLAEQANAGVLADLTIGATLYFSPKGIKTTKTFMLPNGESVPFPQTWNPKAVRYAGEIASQLFFIEV
jgi:spore germination cell wall hydrolase CwlJ-like protein